MSEGKKEEGDFNLDAEEEDAMGDLKVRDVEYEVRTLRG